MPEGKIGFSIEGKFITDFAREKLYKDFDPKTALELLLNSLVSNKLPKAQSAGMALAILDGQAEIRGTYPGSDYGYFPTPNNSHKFLDFFEKITSMREELAALREKNSELEGKLVFIEDRIGNGMPPEEMAEEYMAEYNNELFSPSGNYGSSIIRRFRFLQGSLKDIVEAQEHENNYGWLDPSGKFYPVPWSDHTQWAWDYIQEHWPEDFSEIENSGELVSAKDFMLGRRWLLLHNPGRGRPVLSMLDGTVPTKAQVDFLHGFFEDRNMHAEAKRVLEYIDD